jgi:hypothetical protein
MKHVVLSLALLATPLSSSFARAATPAEVAQSIAAADELFVKGDYEAALTAYRAAYKLQADPELFLKMGRCFQEMAQNDLAISSYERYLTDAPDGARRAAVEQIIAGLRGAAPEELSLELGVGDDAAAAAPAGEPFPEEAAPAGEPFPEEAAPSADEARAAEPPASPPPPPPPVMPPPELPEEPGTSPVVVDPTVWMAVGAAALVVVTGGAVAAALALQPPPPAPQGDLGTFDLR